MHDAAGVGTESSLDFHIERASPLSVYTGVAVLLTDSPAQPQGDPHWSRHLKKRVHVNEFDIFQLLGYREKSVKLAL